MGWSMGGEAHTRNPVPVESDDPRLTIPQGESFEDYMRSRGMGGAAPAAPAPAAPAPAPVAAAPAASAWTPPASWGAPAPAAAPAASASAWATPDVDPNPSPQDGNQALEMGWSMGGEAHTRNPVPVESDDPRLTIPQGESFEEYMKS